MPRTSSKKIAKKEKKIVFEGLSIIEMSAKKVAGEGEVKDINVHWTTEVDSLTGDKLRITAECRVSFDPPMFFELSAKYALEYAHDGLTLDDVEKDINDLAGPCGGKNTLIMAELSQHMQGQPLIVPPYVQTELK